MADVAWGHKHKCLACGAAFYDMRRAPIVCPKCGALHQAVPLLKSDGRSARAARNRARVPVAAEPVPAAAEPESEDDEVGDEETIEDPAELETGDDATPVDDGEPSAPER